MMNNQLELAVVAMVLALNFKQMALYFALPFGFFALAKIWNRKPKSSLVAKLAYTGS